MGRGRPARARLARRLALQQRVDSVNIASGVWRPKKHKAVARAAHQAWRALYKQRGGRVWLRHEKHAKSLWAPTADDLAARGLNGETVSLLGAD